MAQDGHRIGEIPTEEGLFPFMISYDLVKDGVTDCSYLLDAPAGKHGFTHIEGLHFVNDAGPIRFNGLNIVGGANFPSHEQAERMAKRLAHSIACATMFLRNDVDESKDQYVQHLPRKVFSGFPAGRTVDWGDGMSAMGVQF